MVISILACVILIYHGILCVLSVYVQPILPHSDHSGKVPVMAYQCLVVVMTSAKLDEKNRREC